MVTIMPSEYMPVSWDEVSDTAFVLEQLRSHPEGRDQVQIINASFRIRGCGVGAVHSRVSSLREKGYDIPKAEVEGKTRRGFPRYVYHLRGEPAARPVRAPAPPTPAPATPKPHEQLALV